MKTNLFSRFRDLFRKTEPDYDYDESYDEYSDVAVEEPLGAEDAAEDATAETCQSGNVLELPRGASTPEPEPKGKGVLVPLAPIVAELPLELQSHVLYEVGDLSVFLSLEVIFPQLSKGVVLLSFGELRKAAPKVFSTDREQDAAEINVPLSAILPHITPDMLARKHGPLQLDIPDEIVSPFADKGKGLAIGSLKPAVPTPPPASKPLPTPVAKVPTPEVQQAPVPAPKIPLPRPVPAPAQSAQPVQPSSAPINRPVLAQRSDAAPLPPHRAGGNGVPETGIPRSPVAGVTNQAPPAQPVRAPVSSASVTDNGTRIIGKGVVGTPSPVKPVAVPQPALTASIEAHQAHPPLPVLLRSVADAWPDSLKQEILNLNLAGAQLELPYDVVESGLKRGRLSFPWKNLKDWVHPQPETAVSVYDATELELPLRVVAPLFIAQKKEGSPQSSKVAVDKDIPNLFYGLPQPDTAGVAVDHSVNKPVDTNYYVWDDQADNVPDDAGNAARSHAQTAGTEFVTRYATPNEVVSRASGLDGVEGAVIALPDGLMVANHLPPGVNGDTLAAFLPHLFGKVTQCTQELRMGELNNLNFTVGNVPWKIWRINALYFAAFGRKAEALPTAQLAALAGELDHKAKV